MAAIANMTEMSAYFHDSNQKLNAVRIAQGRSHTVNFEQTNLAMAQQCHPKPAEPLWLANTHHGHAV